MSGSIEWCGDGVHWVFPDFVGTESLIALLNDFYGKPDFDRVRYQIRDCRFTKTTSVSVEGVQKIAAFDLAAARSNPKMRVAILIPEGEDCEAYASLYDAELYRSDWKFAVFKDFEAAKAWCEGGTLAA